MRLANAMLQLTFFFSLQVILISAYPASKFSFGRVIGQAARGVKCAGHACFVETPTRATHAVSDAASKAFKGTSSIGTKIQKGYNNMVKEASKPSPRMQKFQEDLLSRKAARVERKQMEIEKEVKKIDKKRQSISQQASATSPRQSTTSEHVSQPSAQDSRKNSFSNEHGQGSTHSSHSDATSNIPQRSHSSQPRLTRAHSN